MTEVTVPRANARSAVETLAGVSFEDPYRNLEENSAEVREWQRAQANAASTYVRAWDRFERVLGLVSKYSAEQRHGDQYRVVPRYAAGRWFRVCSHPCSSSTQVVVSGDPMGSGRVLFDSGRSDEAGPVFVSWIAPSPDGRSLAIGICTDGSENNTIRLIDVGSGALLPGAPPHVLMDNWSGGVQWLPDSSGFFFSAIHGSAVEFHQRVYLHTRNPEPATTVAEIPWIERKDYRWVVIAADGKHAVAMERIVNPIPVAVVALGQGPFRWRPFVRTVSERLAGPIVGDRYFAITDLGADRGRVVAIPLASATPDDPTTWQEVLPESKAVLQTLTPVGNLLYVTELADTYVRVRIVDLDGKVLGEVPLPDKGALGQGWLHPMHSTLPKGHPEKFLFTFSSPTRSPGIYSHTPGEQRVDILQAPDVHIENTVVEDHWATSPDGTRIPYSIVRRADVPDKPPLPTLIYVYGGWNYPLLPQFPGPMAAFVSAGGALVYAHVRGGGEFGLEWGNAGRFQNKQNCYDDLYAIAEDLISTGRSAPHLLALTGRSNGGLVAGVAVTQRPDLWKVVIPQVPILDLIGACRDAYGTMSVTMEHADIRSADEVRRLATISPCQLVRQGVRYPSVYISAGDTDPRCPPWHARKFAALLQNATTGDDPILLHIWENVGHGAATGKQAAIMGHAEWLAFTMRRLGLETWD